MPLPGLVCLQIGAEAAVLSSRGRLAWGELNTAHCSPSLPLSAGGACQTWSGQVSEQAPAHPAPAVACCRGSGNQAYSTPPCDRTAPPHPPACPCSTPDLSPPCGAWRHAQTCWPTVGFGDLFNVMGEDAGRLCPLMSYCKRPEAHEILVPDGHFVQHVSACERTVAGLHAACSA